MDIKRKLENNEDITIDFIGDSITYGMAHCRTEETYVAKFTALLAADFKNYSVYRYDGKVKDELLPMDSFDGPVTVSYAEGGGKIDVIRNGVGGNTVMRALNRIGDFTGILPNGKKQDITFLMFGINDALKPSPDRYVTPDEYKKNYKTLIDRIRESDPQTFMIIMSATYNDWSVDEYCERSKELAAEENIPYIDLNKMWMEHYDASAENFGQGDWLGGGCDACHPTPKASHIMAEKIYDEFLKITGIEK